MHTVYGMTVTATRQEEVFSKNSKTAKYLIKGKTLIADSIGYKATIDLTWLTQAASTYNISDDVRDYIAVGVPVITSDIPNRNLQGFKIDQLLGFNHEHGKLAYRTFVGKPTFTDHINNDVKRAKGVNIDVSLVYVPKYDIHKVFVLSLFDRTKDPVLASAILTGKRNSYSMGAHVATFMCSICGADLDVFSCEHFKQGKGSIINGRLVWMSCVLPVFFENSSVDTPADITAVSTELLNI